MLSDEQLKKAARYLCEKHHLDPDGMDPATLDGPGWKTYEGRFADEIRKHELLHEAMDFARPDSTTVPEQLRNRAENPFFVPQQEGSGYGV